MSKSRDLADWGQFQPVRKNAVINGNFNIWQRGTTFTAATNGLFVADRIQNLRTGDGYLDVDQIADHPLISGGNCFETTVNTIDASLLTTDTYGFQTKIEGYDYQRLHQNECTLSFWVKSNITGTYYGSFTNEGGPPTHSYVYDYTISAANTWEKKTITFTPGTVGTFNMTNGEGLRVRWSVGDGASNQTATLNAWQSGNYRAGTAGANFMATVSNSFRITDVQIEVGSVATDFEYRHYGDELALCQRYYQKFVPVGIGGFANGVNIVEGGFMLPVTLRDNPTVTMTGTARFHDVTGTITSSSAAISPQTANTSSLWFRQTGFSGLTSGNSGVIDFNGNAVEFDSEL